jgi:predicted HAD superfamily phosphohydrolase YqeG
MKPFSQLDTSTIKGNLIILDIDGTLAADASSNVSGEIIKKVKELNINNEIVLCSNRNNHKRNEAVAAKVGVKYLHTNIRKPRLGILKTLQNPHKKPLLVIGDKTMTDGWFAKRIGGKFVKVKRISSKRDSLIAKLIHALDDFAAHFISFN